ncbi:MAG: helicase HerA domain-containing protein [Promethearchaeota archaeon]
MSSFEDYLIPIIIFNLSVTFFSISIMLFSLYFLETDKDIIDLEIPSYHSLKKGTIKLGKCLKQKTKKKSFFLSFRDLEKHIFVCGATGTGKSNFIQNFLLNFTKHYNIPFLLVEFKGEYHFLQKKIENLLIIRPGENFSINIFNPEGILPEVHAERIFDILKSGKFLEETSAEYSPQMEKVLVEILTKVCQKKKLQNWKGFYRFCNAYADIYQNEIPMLSQTLISIRNRIRRFSLGSLKALFDTENEIKIKDLFEKNVLIDLSSIIRLGGEKSDALFFLNMILKYLWDRNITHGAYNFKGIKHITIIEDVQYFAPKNLTKQTKLTTYLEDIALLQRGTGECLISIATHPDISEEILANCGGLIVFKTHMQKEFLCELLNLDVEKQDYLSILEEGQCIIRVNSIKRPFLLSVPFIEREYLEVSEINKYNDLALTSVKNNWKKDLKRINKKKKFFKVLSKLIKNFSKRSKNNYNEKLKLEKQDQQKIKKIQLNNLENHIQENVTSFINYNIENEKEIDYDQKFIELRDFINELYSKREKTKKII